MSSRLSSRAHCQSTSRKQCLLVAWQRVGSGADDGSPPGQSSTEAIKFQFILLDFPLAGWLEFAQGSMGTSKSFWSDFHILQHHVN